MRFEQSWQGQNLTRQDGVFPASVPGCIQQDYAAAKGWGDVQYADNCRAYEALEDDTWEYSAVLRYERAPGERVVFVSRGIDYRYEIRLNGALLDACEGMYRITETDLTDRLRGENDRLTVRILPHPKSGRGEPGTRDEAAECCKPPVCYGWDWNPRLLVSGMWEEAYIETRNACTICGAEVRAELDEMLEEGTVHFAFACSGPCETALFDPDGKEIWRGDALDVTVEHPRLWWCNGQGEAALYRWEIRSAGDVRTGTVGFRRLRLVRNIGAGDPKQFPKSRYDAPATVELNGRRIMAKGSNWVNPDLFPGAVDSARYETLLTLVRDANMNLLRVWGGAGPAKDCFYDLCDRLGILVWQEFMLACNDYRDEAHYLRVLEREATAVILRLRAHPCLAFWCGGNELFNSWSGMDDQSHALRLLNKLCYELDADRPFLPTSPLTGMGHGGYRFNDPDGGGEVFAVFQNSRMTAYTEFGVPSVSPVENLRRAIPEAERFPPRETPAWTVHHGFGAWGADTWLCLPTLEEYFGKADTLEELIAQSDRLQCAGCQAIFEEARRQWKHCSMCLNWCFNEPWMTAANNSLIAYPAKPKPAYGAVRRALNPVLFTARIAKYRWRGGETFEAELWFHNDTPEEQCGRVTVTVSVGDWQKTLETWETSAPANGNTRGNTVRTVLPKTDAEWVILTLESPEGYSNAYELRYKASSGKPWKKVLNRDADPAK
ncbi:MAG: glycoside hydrolase family 2 TIM barrel-domain containing protein [Eubacteriales bacterium]|nr:glycoside hydrolase family 2 TIM barrel-domain containing protein [Eubacteriales bacterium]